MQNSLVMRVPYQPLKIEETRPDWRDLQMRNISADRLNGQLEWGCLFFSCINAVFLTKKGHIKYSPLNVNMYDHENKKSRLITLTLLA